MLKTVQMGQTGIRCAMEADLSPELKTAMHSQLREYDELERQILATAAGNGWKLDNVHLGAKSMAKASVKTRLTFGDVDTKTASMMVQGNARGIMQCGKNLYKCDDASSEVTGLVRKLMETETRNILQMQGFL